MTLSNKHSIAADRAHVFHSWSAQGALEPLPIAGGTGAVFWDNEGKRYLDFSSQLVNLNLGHQHPRLIEAVTEQAGTLCTVAPSFSNDTRSRAAEMIVGHAPDRLNRVFFTNGGAEAVENAVRMARHHTGRHKVLSAYRSYHGATATAITLTGEPRRWGAEPGDPGVVHFFGPYPYRSHFGAATAAEEKTLALAHLEEVIQMEGPQQVAAIVLETVVGTNGVLVPPDGYLAGVRDLCDQYGILMVCDEVMVGFGRTGEWFAVDNWGVAPDLITFAKGVNSGYVPLGGVLLTENIADTFRDSPYPGGLTYSGHPLACATAVASISVMEDEGIVERAAELGRSVLGPGLSRIAERHPSVGELRGLGCFWALELVRGRETREPLVPYAASGPDAAPMAELGAELRSRGLWPFLAGNRLQIAPPLVITEEELVRGMDIIDESLDVADRHVADG